MENKYLVIEIGSGDKLFSTIDYKDDMRVGLSISERKGDVRDIGNKIHHPDGTTIDDINPIVVIVTENIGSLVSLRDQLNDSIDFLKSKLEADDEQIQ